MEMNLWNRIDDENKCGEQEGEESQTAKGTECSKEGCAERSVGKNRSSKQGASAEQEKRNNLTKKEGMDVSRERNNNSRAQRILFVLKLRKGRINTKTGKLIIYSSV